METSTLLSAPAWAEQTVGKVRLGHRSRTERAVAIASAIAADPTASLPKQMGSEAALHAAYRFLQTPMSAMNSCSARMSSRRERRWGNRSGCC